MTYDLLSEKTCSHMDPNTVLPLCAFSGSKRIVIYCEGIAISRGIGELPSQEAAQNQRQQLTFAAVAKTKNSIKHL